VSHNKHVRRTAHTRADLPFQQQHARAAIQLFDSAFVHLQISDFNAPF